MIQPARRHLIASFMGLCMAIAACADGNALDACSEGEEGLAVVVSGSEGLWERAGKRARLMELWRRGGLNEGEELVYPASFSVSVDGRIAIADFSLSEVIVVEPDGTWRGAWAPRGKGPGELSTPVAATWGRDGTLAVYDLTGSKVLFLRGGASARPDVAVPAEVGALIYLAGELPWAGVQPEGSVVLQPPAQMPPPGAEPEPERQPEILLLRYAAGSNHPDTLERAVRRAQAMVEGFTVPGWPRLTASVGTDGAIAVGGEDSRYRIVVYDSAARPVRAICRRAAPLPLSAAERGVAAPEDFPAELAAALQNAPPPDTLAPFGRIFWGARGRLWVQRHRTSPFIGDFLGTPGGPYDVFDAEGQFLGEVAAPPTVRLQGATGDTVFGFETGALDEAILVAYRLVLE